MFRKSDNSKIIMIACVSPGFSSANHTINTLRYSDRLKEKTSMMNKINKVQENNYLKSKDDGSPNVIIKTKNLLEELDVSILNVYNINFYYSLKMICKSWNLTLLQLQRKYPQ